MFLINQRRVTTALLLSISLIMLSAKITAAQGSSSAAIPQPPPQILSVNDPHNPFHYTAEQQRTLLAIKTQYQAQAEAISQNSSLTDAQKYKEIDSLREESIGKIKAQLTPDQITKEKAYAALINKDRAALIDLRTQLAKTLTPDQKKTALQLRTSLDDKAEAISQSSASQQQKEQQLNQLRITATHQISGLWTPQQRALIRQMTQVSNSDKAAEQRILSGN